MIRLLEQQADGICIYEMENDQLKVIVSSYGVTLMEIDMKAEDGTSENVILGYPTIADYQKKSGTYFGALVGRTANRIANGKFKLNGKEYSLFVNNGPNALHGGKNGFSYRNFDSRIEGGSLIFTYHAQDLEEGYPGNLDLTCTLKLQGNELKIDYDAQSDQDTLCALTHHTYFNPNLAQDGSNLLLQINAQRHGLIDENVLATGQFREVDGTPLDFRTPKPIASSFDFADVQIKNANGIDHHFVLDGTNPALVLSDPISGRSIEIETSFPGVQVYTGNFLENEQGRDGIVYGKNYGIAIEPQYVPDSIHNQEHPDAILKAGQTMHEEIVYRFVQAK